MIDPEAIDVTIVDGYVDEPAHFGVPPYVSTYPRYTAGALVDAGVPRDRITYYTIDQLREDRQRWSAVADADLLIYIGGMTVPGSYVGGTPAEPDEVREIAWTADGVSVMGGPAKFGVGEENAGAIETERDELDFDYLAMGDIEAAAYDVVENDLEGFDGRYRDVEEVTRWARKGAFVVEQHPNHPEYLLCELETGRGCPYRCSFCTEPLYGDATFRPPETVVAEVDALNDHGVRHFRLGRQADILAYGGDGEKPNPGALRALYRGIRRVAPDLETLHLDNMNPITIVQWPELAREGIRVVARHNTPGDTAAFGLESADPVVQEQNNLNVTTEECFEAVRIVNEAGGWRPGGAADPRSVAGSDVTDAGTGGAVADDAPSYGDAVGAPASDDPETAPNFGSDAARRLPKLLPGINLVHGLDGERDATFEHNRQFLQRVYDEGYVLRRVNIRQVMAFPGTDMDETGAQIAHDHKQQFKRYKREVREEIDNPMLQRVAPPGTVLRNVHLEYHQDGKTFGRQLGTYPLLVGIPGERDLGSTIDVAVVDHGFRSITGVPYPLDLNAASMDELTALPGVGKQRAGDIVVNRPYDALGDVGVDLDLRSFAAVDASAGARDAGAD